MPIMRRSACMLIAVQRLLSVAADLTGRRARSAPLIEAAKNGDNAMSYALAPEKGRRQRSGSGRSRLSIGRVIMTT